MELTFVNWYIFIIVRKKRHQQTRKPHYWKKLHAMDMRMPRDRTKLMTHLRQGLEWAADALPSMKLLVFSTISSFTCLRKACSTRKEILGKYLMSTEWVGDPRWKLTVAGEATSRSIGSNIRLVVGANWMISPLIRHSFLLSSKTVFIFSIQMASTGPSNISHFLSGV